MKALRILSVLGLLAVVISAFGVAHAASPIVTTSANGEDPGIMWIEATVFSSARDIKIVILAPKSGAGREVWQRCSFALGGAGTYRCGIDVGRGSIAGGRKGNWLARVRLDGVIADRLLFVI